MIPSCMLHNTFSICSLAHNETKIETLNDGLASVNINEQGKWATEKWEFRAVMEQQRQEEGGHTGKTCSECFAEKGNGSEELVCCLLFGKWNIINQLEKLGKE